MEPPMTDPDSTKSSGTEPPIEPPMEPSIREPGRLKTQDEMRVALRRIRMWENGGKTEPVTCPICGAPGLDVEDHSARPYSEWYFVRCASCGLDDKIHIASASRSP